MARTFEVNIIGRQTVVSQPLFFDVAISRASKSGSYPMAVDQSARSHLLRANGELAWSWLRNRELPSPMMQPLKLKKKQGEIQVLAMPTRRDKVSPSYTAGQ